MLNCRQLLTQWVMSEFVVTVSASVSIRVHSWFNCSFLGLVIPSGFALRLLRPDKWVFGYLGISLIEWHAPLAQSLRKKLKLECHSDVHQGAIQGRQ